MHRRRRHLLLVDGVPKEHHQGRTGLGSLTCRIGRSLRRRPPTAPLQGDKTLMDTFTGRPEYRNQGLSNVRPLGRACTTLCRKYTPETNTEPNCGAGTAKESSVCERCGAYTPPPPAQAPPCPSKGARLTVVFLTRVFVVRNVR